MNDKGLLGLGFRLGVNFAHISGAVRGRFSEDVPVPEGKFLGGRRTGGPKSLRQERLGGRRRCGAKATW
jgi:hypothetical protein